MSIRQVVMMVAALGVVGTPVRAQIRGKWVPDQCGLRTSHTLVRRAVGHLKAAVESRSEEQGRGRLAEAGEALREALSSGGQQDDPAAWYYLARYHLVHQDMVGADSAFTRAVALRGQCADDVSTWRRFYWVPVLNAGVAAWQSGDTDSAIASFQRANAIYRDEPQGLLYIAVLYANSDQADSAVKYFQAGIKAAGSDTTFATEKKEATFNLARVYHRAERWDEAAATYRAYLADNPNDVEATAALASIQSIRGQSDSAAALYAAVLDRADAVSFRELLQAGISIFRGAPPEPDSAVVRRACGAPARRACRDSLEARHDSLSRETYRLAGRAFEAVLTKNPHYRDALFNLANVVYQLRDTVRLLPVAQRLVAADPLNRSANLLLAHGYQFAGKGDSALHYLEVADDGLPAELTVTNLRLDERAASVAGLVANFHDRPTPALTLVFEFLDTGGKVIATQTLQVPGLPAKENYSFTVQAAGQGIVAYRYRTS